MASRGERERGVSQLSKGITAGLGMKRLSLECGARVTDSE